VSPSPCADSTNTPSDTRKLSASESALAPRAAKRVYDHIRQAIMIVLAISRVSRSDAAKESAFYRANHFRGSSPGH
jgi:hypothetical protein